MSTNSDDDGQHEEDSNTVAHLDDQVEKVVVIDGKEVKVKISDTHSQGRRGPKVTFRIQEKHGGPVHYAKIYLPKTHEEARVAAFSCFEILLTYPGYSPKAGELMDFGLKATIRKNDDSWTWAHIRPAEWWDIMNELIKENPNLEVGVFPYE